MESLLIWSVVLDYSLKNWLLFDFTTSQSSMLMIAVASLDTIRMDKKGKGASLIIADFVYANFSWLCSPNGTWSARKNIKPRKNCKGYFINKDIYKQANEAMDILDKFYPEYKHVFVYDNAMTHCKCTNNALLICKMPQNTLKPDANWLVEVNQLNIDRNQVHITTGKFAKKHI